MATTTGNVQQVLIPVLNTDTSTACVWIGPTPSNTELLVVERKKTDEDHIGALKNSILDALVTALAFRLQVAAEHGEGDSKITSLSIKA